MNDTEPLLLWNGREFNELGERVETRPLRPWEREPQDGDSLVHVGYACDFPVTFLAYSSLDGGYWICRGLRDMFSVSRVELMKRKETWQYASRHDNGPLSVELYPPRPITTADRPCEVGDQLNVKCDGLDWSFTATEDESQEGNIALFTYVSRTDNGPVTVSTRPKANP